MPCYPIKKEQAEAVSGRFALYIRYSNIFLYILKHFVNARNALI
jgi:FtsH-binding integral membrane protein